MQEKSSEDQAHLYLYPDKIVWASMSFEGGRSQRPCCAILLGLRAPLELHFDNGNRVCSQAVLVGQNVARRISARKAGFISLTLDPTHPSSRVLQQDILGSKPYLQLAWHPDKDLKKSLEEMFSADCTEKRVTEVCEKLIESLFPDIDRQRAIDPRVLSAARYLQRELPSRLPLAELATQSHLSPSRFRHLFSHELGISASSYLRWCKLYRAAELFARQRSTTEVAAAIGFADAAHMIRVFQQYYSISPSYIADWEHVCVQSGKYI